MPEPEVERVDLPDVVLTAWAVNAHRVKDEDGVEHAVVILTIEFQPAPGHVARQSVILAKDDAVRLRADLKSPTPIVIPTQENNPS